MQKLRMCLTWKDKRSPFIFGSPDQVSIGAYCCLFRETNGFCHRLNQRTKSLPAKPTLQPHQASCGHAGKLLAIWILLSKARDQPRKGDHQVALPFITGAATVCLAPRQQWQWGGGCCRKVWWDFLQLTDSGCWQKKKYIIYEQRRLEITFLALKAVRFLNNIWIIIIKKNNREEIQNNFDIHQFLGKK